MARVDRADVLAALTGERVLEYFAIPFRRSGAELRFQVCPACGPRSRIDTVSASSQTGLWLDHAHGCKGDILAMIAGLAELTIEREFARVLEVAADIAGVVTPANADTEHALRRDDRARRQQLERAAADARRVHGESAARSIWDRLVRESEAGLAYLRSRRLDPIAAEVRYGRWSVCIPLRDAAGHVVNVIGRRIGDGQPKVRGLAGCGTLGVFGDVRRLPETDESIVVVEGLADFLSARVLWPGRLVLGAHGAGRIPDVAAVAADLARTAPRGILFVPHPDDVGRRQVDRAITVAATAGVPLEDIEVLVLDSPTCDLNDYLREDRS